MDRIHWERKGETYVQYKFINTDLVTHVPADLLLTQNIHNDPTQLECFKYVSLNCVYKYACCTSIRIPGNFHFQSP